MPALIVDIHEDDNIAQWLSQYIQVGRGNLEPLGLLDYMWFAADGHQITLEHKTWQALTSIHEQGRLETQLHKASGGDKELGVVVRGIPVPLAGGEIALFDEGRNDKYLRRIHISGTKYAEVVAFLWRLDKEGVSVYQTTTTLAFVLFLKTVVENSLKPEFTTLKRYIRGRTLALLWTPDPVVESFMGIKDGNGYVLGEKKAKEVAKQFGSLWNAANATPTDIAGKCYGVGLATAKRFLEAIRKGSS